MTHDPRPARAIHQPQDRAGINGRGRSNSTLSGGVRGVNTNGIGTSGGAIGAGIGTGVGASFFGRGTESGSAKVEGTRRSTKNWLIV